jgi:hypothetical protein
MFASRLVKGILILGLMLSAGFAQGPAKLEGWSYHTDNGYLSEEWADKTGKALCDGDRSRKGTTIYSGGTITIDIDLGKPARVTSVVAHASRPNNNYRLRTFTVLAKSLGHFQPVGSVEGFWGPTKQRDFALTVKDLDVTTDQLRLVFETPSILCLQEVEVFGAPTGAAAAAEIRLAPLNAAQPSAREADVDGDGKPEVILENNLVRLIFWPSAGGVCRSFLYKPAQAELTAAADSRYGLLRDQLWSPNYSFADRPYDYRTGGDARSAWVELSTSGAGGMMSFTRLTKRVQIERDSPIARVHYRLLNDPSSQTEYLYGLWFHHFTGVPGVGNRYFDPTTEGVRELRFDPGAGDRGSEVWYREPARGWTAVVGAKGAGLAMTLDYKYLNCFYHWSGVGVPVATHEWRFNRIPLKSGESLETEVALIPFQGLERVDGVAQDVIGAISLEGEKSALVTLCLASPRSKPATGLIRLRRLPDGPWQELGRLDVSPGKPATKRIDLAGLATGGYVLNCQVQRGGQDLDDLERAFVQGDARLAYTRAPREERVGLAADERPALPRHDLTDSIVTPHVAWARPLPGGPIKAVVLCDDTMAREVIELKQRLDLDPTYVKFRTHHWKEDLWCGDRSISTPEQANRRLLEYLKANRYELFVLAGFDWHAHFTPEVRDAITAQVRDGAGLLFIMPDGFKAEDPLAPMMGLAKGRSMHAWAEWKREGDSPLTAGLPWSLFPQTRFMSYERPPEGNVLARLSNGQPLLVTNQLGKGRTVALTYDVLTHEMSYRGYAGLTPTISYRGGFLRPEYAEMTWSYHEPWYALLARLSAWAAGRDTGVRVASLEPVDDAANAKALSLKLEGGKETYRVSAQFRNRWSHPLQQVEVTCRPGQTEVSIPLPARLGAGVNLVDVIIRDAAGRSVAWGQTYVRAKAPLAIKSVLPEKEIVFGERAPRADQPYDRAFRPQEPFRVKVTLEGAGTPPAGSRVRARLYDTHRRLLFEEIRALPAGTSELTFEARPAELRSMGLGWEIATLDPQGESDLSYARVICRWPRDWNRFRLSSWNGLFPWRSEYLYGFLAPLVEELVDVAFYGRNELETGHVWRHYWHNIDWCYLDLMTYMGDIPRFADAKFAEKAARYNETKSKEWLVREPSLSDMEWRAKVAEHLKGRATQAMRFGGAYDYCMGDEMSLTHYTRYFDYDWSPHALGAFRKWLQVRYASLDALNKAWETNFTSWDAVVPMTLHEVTGRANAAPWAEFRSFMNDSVADFFAMAQASLKSVDPQARAGLSGTQEPRSGNGMDWWKNSQAFNYYHSYNTGWSNEMRRSFAPYTGTAQSPYYAGYWQAGRAIEYNFFWCLLHDTEAVSAWTTPIFFYNDFTYSESGRDTLALCREMKLGLWDLIRNARREHDGIALHYSQNSINAATLLGKDEEIVRHRDAWVKLIEEMGLQYDFVATPQIEDGILRRGDSRGNRYRVLILPESFAVSDKEKAEIEAFVRAGGTVIADRGAGLMDGKCRRGDQGVLDGLFGLRRTDSGGEGTLGIQVRMPGIPASELKFPVAEALAPTTAKPLGQSAGEQPLPALLRNGVGNGAAWYLNLDLSPFDNERVFHTPAEKGLRSILDAILAEAGVKPQVGVSLASGRAPHLEVVRYTAGDLTYVGLLHAREEKEELATISFPETAHVYDCRKGEALGTLREVRASFAGGEARLYCLAPKPLAEPRLTLAAPAAAKGETVRYSVRLNGGSDRQKQLVRLTVFRPDGSEYADYARNLYLGEKGFTGEFRLALNDPAGAWKIVVRDLCSGAQSVTTFTVR